MRSDKQIQASKINGACSSGPITDQGKRNSARNSTRHGLLAQTVVVEVESMDRFHKLLQAYMDEFQPRTESQVTLVETMAVTRWRQLRSGKRRRQSWIALRLSRIPVSDRCLSALSSRRRLAGEGLSARCSASL
jgi:hypothetical protein